MPLSDEDIHEILRIIDETPLAEVRIETDGFSLHVVKAGDEASAPAEPEAGDEADTDAEAAPTPPPAPRPASEELIAVKAPMLGVFYRADAPGEQPFVEQGSHVDPDTTVCIIEVMKMMNSVRAGVSGTVIEVCQENGAIVQEGATLFRVAPG